MKIIKKIFITFLSAVSLCGCAVRTDIIPQNNLALSQNDSQYTEISAQTVCDEITGQLSAENSDVYFDAHINSDMIKNAVALFKKQNPDFFWLNGYTIVTDNRSTKIEFNILNNYSADELSEMHSRLTDTAQYIASLAENCESDYEKILFVHDYIIKHTEYDFDGAGSGQNGIWGTAYGCLVNGSAICQGYSEAFLEIMNKLGIECGVCAGDSERGRHAWNYVKLNDKYYWLDLTWDDPESSESEYGRLEHKYFLINDEMLMRTRSLDQSQYFIPECHSLDDNYFVKNGCYMERYDIDEIGSKMSGYSESREISIMFSSDEVYAQAVCSLFENEDIWSALTYVGEYSEIKYSSDDAMRVITIDF
ncbi:MAG: hypothetical protein IJ666_02845 [Ruminococcus sp.]|nr:hypothetical protein [Ruminococcus sp.]